MITEKTKVVIISEVLATDSFEPFYRLVPRGGIHVNKKNHKPFVVFPNLLILILDSDISKESLPDDANFHRRFEVIECTAIREKVNVNKLHIQEGVIIIGTKGKGKEPRLDDFIPQSMMISAEQAKKTVDNILSTNPVIAPDLKLSKDLILIGPARSGKSMLARKIAHPLGSLAASWLDGRYPRLFNFRYSFDLPATTELVVIDDLRPDTALKAIYVAMYWNAFGMIIQRRGSAPIIIHPRLIITFDERVKQSDLSQIEGLSDQFEIIDLTPNTNG